MYRIIVSLVYLIVFNVMTANATSIIKYPEFPNLFIVDHPLVQHKMTIMRQKNTDTPTFRRLMREIAVMIGYELTRTLPTATIGIETPLAKTKAKIIDEHKIVLVPILRAGLGMAEGLHQLIPTAREGHIGTYRDPQTKMPVEYLIKLPEIKDQTFIVVDPMMATGGSGIHAVQKLKERGIPGERIRFMALVAAPEGIRAFQKAHPDVQVYAAALDEKLDDHAYIIPGLGDAGDRLYGTK
jgi:uracil phosphoribosyltransferase